MDNFTLEYGTKSITVEKLRKQVEKKGLAKYDKLIVIAGREYIGVVRNVFPGKK